MQLVILLDAFNGLRNEMIDSVALKISKTIGLLLKLKRFVPFYTLINIYNSLITPYLRYGLVAWGQLTSKTQLSKLLILRKRALHFMHFADRRDCSELSIL